MVALPHMRVSHTSPGRLRLRTSEHGSAEPRFFAQLAERLSESPLIHEVRMSARTGSMLVLFSGELPELLSWVRDLGLIALDPPRPHQPMLRIKHALQESERRLAKHTHGVVTVGSLGFAVMSAAAVFQAGSGYLFPSALSLLELALKAMEREAEREQSELPGRS